MPEIREFKWDRVIVDYLKFLESQKDQISEQAKSVKFLLLLKDLFGLQPNFIEEYVSGIEKYVKVKRKDLLLKGRVDNLFGNLVIEFERDLIKNKKEAEEQLRKYIACLWSQEEPSKRTPYLGIAADGLNFAVYSPVIEDLREEGVNPDEVNFCLVDETNLSSLKPKEIYFWLDRYFQRQEILSPKTENIVKDFGTLSHAFTTAQSSLISLWESVKAQGEFQVIFENWEKYLRIVYGTFAGEEELFCRHTYLAILAKLMVWSRLSEGQLDDAKILSVLEGQFFKEKGIENFLEEDFFSWIVREDLKDTGIDVARKLLSLLKNYNLRELSEDVFKSLYQALVDPKTRHDLGEYYTPDWLAHKIVQELVSQNEKGSFLDPACGSGTFLYLVIKEKRQKLGDSVETLNHILISVFGVDIHPLAVIVAKTNYLLALGELLKKQRGKIHIPVYLSNSIRLPEKRSAKEVEVDWFQGDVYGLEIDGKKVYFSQSLMANPVFYDEGIEAAKEYAENNRGKPISRDAFKNFLQAQHYEVAQDEDAIKALFHITKTLKEFIEKNRDTIWTFILKNIYKPLFLKGKFDFIIGNPPWLAFRYAEPGYQKFLKEQITKNYNLLSGRGELITHLELGTLFYLRTADLYLKEKGIIAFVLPRSIFTADQHDGLRQGKFTGIGLNFKEVWDFEDVEPLFNVPSCVLFAQKEESYQTVYPISGKIYKGKLERRNASLEEAQKSLSEDKVHFYLHKRGKRSFWAQEKSLREEKESFYKGRFSQGASIVPRSLWFVEVKESSLGFNPNLPPVQSSKRAREEAKEAYKGLIMEGNIENRFLYTTLLSTDLVPFGHLGYRLVVLPIEPINNSYHLINADEARKKGFVHLYNWLEKAQKEWETRRGAKAKDISAIEWLNYRHKLTSQNSQAMYRVLYNTSGTFLCACVVANISMEKEIGGQKVTINGFIADTKIYYFETANLDEAFYLTAILNAPEINALIKPMQSRGQWGPRDIHKKVLELPIPQFDPKNQTHLHLAELGKSCNEKVEEWIRSGGPGNIKNIGALRAGVRKMLKEELDEINSLVRQVLGF